MKNKSQALVMSVLVIGIILFLSLSPSFTNVEDTTRVLKEAGYKPIKVGGYGWFAGDKNDWSCTKFEAISPNGAHVHGVVSGGWFKAYTIRLQ